MRDDGNTQRHPGKREGRFSFAPESFDENRSSENSILELARPWSIIAVWVCSAVGSWMYTGGNKGFSFVTVISWIPILMIILTKSPD